MRSLHALLAGLLLLLGAAPAAADPTAGPSPGSAPSRHGVWPLQPRPTIERGFDPPATRFGRGHRGVDLLGHAGQQVHTSLAGRVSFASSLAGRGVVVVTHGELRTTYEPVRATVHVGDVLPAGGVLGTLAAGGSHCAPRACLHWGLLRGATYLDPLTLVGAGPVRLLPLTSVTGTPAVARTAWPTWTAPAVRSRSGTPRAV